MLAGFCAMKLGEILVSKGLVGAEAVREALDRQASLRAKGAYHPLGEILVEGGALARQDLNRCLAVMRRDALARSLLFSGISAEDRDSFLARCPSQVQPEGSTVIPQGGNGGALFLIVSGTVQACAEGSDGQECVLKTYLPGQAFGETGFLSGAPSPAAYITLTSAHLLVFTRRHFREAFGDNPEVLKGFIRVLTERIGRENAELLEKAENERAFHRFAATRTEIPFFPLAGRSNAYKKMSGQIREAAKGTGPVLFSGPPGARKPGCAKAVHDGSPCSGGPFLFMDAAQAGAGQPVQELPADRDLAQYVNLFGCEHGALSSGGTKAPGLLAVGRGGSVVVENIEKLSPFVQDALFEYLATGAFRPLGSMREESSDTRIMATTTLPADDLAESGFFSPRLLERLTPCIVSVAPLAKRKKDLGEIVEAFIARENAAAGKSVQGIEPKAYQRIMAYDWPGDVEELAVVVRRAVSLAETDLLMPEDLFIGLAPPEGKHVASLFALDGVKKLFSHRLFPVLPQVLASVFMAAFVLVALWGSQDPEENVTVTLAWALLWPLTVLSWLLGARGWCGVCPMGAAGDLARKLARPKRKVPAFIRDKGLYLCAAGLLVIVWVERAADMPFSPLATAILVLAITALSAAAGLLFERRLWCRHLCPLGMLSAVFSGCSVVEWRANRGICNTACPAPACYKGNQEVEGCPMYQGPFALTSNRHCILCGNCVKLCERSSPVLQLRVPGHELWAMAKPDKTLAVFVPAIVATQAFRMAEQGIVPGLPVLGISPQWIGLAVLMAALALLSFLSFGIYGRILAVQAGGSDAAGTDLAAYSLIPLCTGYELAYHFGPLLRRSGHLLPELGRTLGGHLESLDFTAALGSALPWQFLFLVTGAAGSLFVLSRLIKKHREPPKTTVGLKDALPLLSLFILYLSSFIAQVIA
ncbi:MAG: sigma 54-interacting transcriptional regulator [Thermodesulfobacteriota bacterium]